MPHGRAGPWQINNSKHGKPHPILKEISLETTHAVHIVTEEERNVYHQDFAHIDKDGSAVIDAEEIAMLLQAHATISF